MSVNPHGWSIGEYSSAYRHGASVIAVTEEVLTSLASAPAGVLIGEPLAALATADAARLAQLDPLSLPLYGVPFVVKDNIDVGGVATTAGCPGFAYLAEADATIVALLRAAGAIVVAKANLDQFATGLVGTRSPYGTPINSLDPELVPGGSSSGSAIAVALGLVPFSLGTDTAGSGRVPAALNGIVGLKPTLGSTSTRGVVPAVRRLDCPSVFASSADDAAFVGRILRGVDPLDPFSRRRDIAEPVSMRTVPVIGVPARWPASLELAEEMECWFEEAIRVFDDLPVQVRRVDITALVEAGTLLYGSALVAERAVAAGDAVAKGVDGLDPVVAGIISRAVELTAVEVYRAEYELTRLRQAARPLWDDIDILVLPTTPVLATLDDVRRDPLGTNDALGRLTTFANLLDLTSMVVPVPVPAARVSAERATELSYPPATKALPGAALQLIAAAWHDDDVAAVASALTTGTISRQTQPCTLVVVGAHLEGLPLHHQLLDRRATLVRRDTTSSRYRLYALANTTPAKPGLVRTAPGDGSSIDVELWSMGAAEFGTFVQQIPSPLCIGSVELSDGSRHCGFLCEPEGVEGAADITASGGWRAYLRSV